MYSYIVIPGAKLGAKLVAYGKNYNTVSLAVQLHFYET